MALNIQPDDKLVMEGVPFEEELGQMGAAPRRYELTAIEKIGEGGFGQVWMCSCIGEIRGNRQRLVCEKQKVWATICAVKFADITKKDQRDMIKREAHLLADASRLLGPRRVTQLHFFGGGTNTSRGHERLLGCCMDFVKGPSLLQVIGKMKARREKFRKYEVHSVWHDLTDALWILHEEKIVHCDVKPANIMMGFDGDARLCDFGNSIRLADFPAGDDRDMPQAGTVHYMAPELFFLYDKGPVRYTTKIDVWSAGVLGYELIMGRLPWLDEQGQLIEGRARFLELFPFNLGPVDTTVFEHDPQRGDYDFGGPGGDWDVTISSCLVRHPDFRCDFDQHFSVPASARDEYKKMEMGPFLRRLLNGDPLHPYYRPGETFVVQRRR